MTKDIKPPKLRILKFSEVTEDNIMDNLLMNVGIH